jgi:putative tryptophan/tyrosine transport system substrate-binding protein
VDEAEKKHMKEKIRVLTLCALLPALYASAEAQQATKKIPRVGILSLNPASVQKDRVEAFREALRKLGYVEGQNINIEYRYGDNKSERMRGLAAELVHLNVDVIVTTGSSATRPAKEATTTIPIVMMSDNDPVGSGFVTSLARPGGNITGLTNISGDLGDKRLELLNVQFFFNETKSRNEVSHFWFWDSHLENPAVDVEKRPPYLP